jgi:hypothetical protein
LGEQTRSCLGWESIGEAQRTLVMRSRFAMCSHARRLGGGGRCKLEYQAGVANRGGVVRQPGRITVPVRRVDEQLDHAAM